MADSRGYDRPEQKLIEVVAKVLATQLPFKQARELAIRVKQDSAILNQGRPTAASERLRAEVFRLIDLQGSSDHLTREIERQEDMELKDLFRMVRDFNQRGLDLWGAIRTQRDADLQKLAADLTDTSKATVDSWEIGDVEKLLNVTEDILSNKEFQAQVERVRLALGVEHDEPSSSSKKSKR